MKKLLLGSIALTLFAISIMIFQLSCKKEAIAQQGSYTLPAATTSSLGGVIIGNGLSVTSNGTLSVTTGSGGLTQLNKIIYRKVIIGGTPGQSEIWMANYDGTGNAKVNITLPSGTVFAAEMIPALSPNGQKIFFTAGLSTEAPDSRGHIYSCNVDGSSVTKIVDKGGSFPLSLGGAY